MWKVSSESCQSISLCLSGKSSHHEKTGSLHPLTRKKCRPTGTAQNKSTWKDGFLIGKQDVDLRYVEQLIDPEQTAALGLLLKYAIEKLADDCRTVADIIEILSDSGQNGLSFLSGGSYISCGYAIPRLRKSILF